MRFAPASQFSALVYTPLTNKTSRGFNQTGFPAVVVIRFLFSVVSANGSRPPPKTGVSCPCREPFPGTPFLAHFGLDVSLRYLCSGW
jgi:hypothetical protein